MFSSSQPVAASSDCSQLGNTLCLCLPVRPAQALQERCPKSWAIDFAVKTFDCLLKQPFGVIARWQAGAWTWTQTWTLQPDQWVVEVLSAQKPGIICVEFELSLGLYHPICKNMHRCVQNKLKWTTKCKCMHKIWRHMQQKCKYMRKYAKKLT